MYDKNKQGYPIIANGRLSFHDKDGAEAIIQGITKQIDLCKNLDPTNKCFRIEWEILYLDNNWGQQELDKIKKEIKNE